MDSNRKRSALLVLAGGLVAGTFDITYACVYWAIKIGAPPTRIFQSVARGLLGPASFRGGAATAALGLFLHYFIAVTMSVLKLLPSGEKHCWSNAGSVAARAQKPWFWNAT